MAAPCRSQAVIDAPVDEVWAVVADPKTHSEWWPDVVGVKMDGELVEGGEYLREEVKRPLLAGSSIWVADQLDDELKHAHFHCTLSGMYAHFELTRAQDNTFIEVETGMLPTNIRWRVINGLSRQYWRNWVRDALDALPDAVARRTAR